MLSWPASRRAIHNSGCCDKRFLLNFRTPGVKSRRLLALKTEILCLLAIPAKETPMRSKTGLGAIILVVLIRCFRRAIGLRRAAH